MTLWCIFGSEQRCHQLIVVVFKVHNLRHAVITIEISYSGERNCWDFSLGIKLIFFKGEILIDLKESKWNKVVLTLKNKEIIEIKLSTATMMEVYCGHRKDFVSMALCCRICYYFQVNKTAKKCREEWKIGSRNNIEWHKEKKNVK